MSVIILVCGKCGMILGARWHVMDFLHFTRVWEYLDFRFLSSGSHSSDRDFSSQAFLNSFFPNFSTKMIEFWLAQFFWLDTSSIVCGLLDGWSLSFLSLCYEDCLHLETVPVFCKTKCVLNLLPIPCVLLWALSISCWLKFRFCNKCYSWCFSCFA